jgi:hypothetical protein
MCGDFRWEDEEPEAEQEVSLEELDKFFKELLGELFAEPERDKVEV